MWFALLSPRRHSHLPQMNSRFPLKKETKQGKEERNLNEINPVHDAVHVKDVLSPKTQCSFIMHFFLILNDGIHVAPPPLRWLFIFVNFLKKFCLVNTYLRLYIRVVKEGEVFSLKCTLIELTIPDLSLICKLNILEIFKPCLKMGFRL